MLDLLKLVHMGKKVCKTAKIRNRYNQVPHLIKDTLWESDKKKTSDTKESRGQPFPGRLS